MSAKADRQRLDKWLWAARFYKTRTLASLAIDAGQVRITVQQLLTSSVIKEYTMARDFRVAMNQICRAAVERNDLLTESSLRVVDWLRGDLRSVRTLRSAMIFERINRYNARSMLASLGQWVRRAGRSGLLIVVDVSRFASRSPSPGPDGTEVLTEAADVRRWRRVR